VTLPLYPRMSDVQVALVCDTLRTALARVPTAA
jgi:dTDP-4-amino-4,6-dideoxygalactose transaminase